MVSTTELDNLILRIVELAMECDTGPTADLDRERFEKELKPLLSVLILGCGGSLTQ